MIDSILSLAFSMHSNKGVFALLLGSGVSRAAGILTGWEIALNLIRKLALLRGEDCEPDPAAWYTMAFGQEPDYAKLLNALAQSPAERSQLLDYLGLYYRKITTPLLAIKSMSTTKKTRLGGREGEHISLLVLRWCGQKSARPFSFACQDGHEGG
jgi:hypothetical protein